MKQIFINGRFLSQAITGVQRYAIELVKEFDVLMAQGEFNGFAITLLSPQRINYELNLKHIIHQRVGMMAGHLWEQLELPLYSLGGLLMNPCNTGPLLKRNQIVTIHDAAVFCTPKAYSVLFRLGYRFLLRWLGATARQIITVSSFSKEELIKYCRVEREKIQVIYLGKEHILSIRPDEAFYEKHDLKNKPFILAVSSMNPNKNFGSIVKAFQLLQQTNLEVVIVGGWNPKVFSKENNSLPESVKYLGYVNDNELKVLYEHAACFIFPSFYEGFGLPPLEAMSCDCPVIVAKAASLPEVCGDAVLYCDPHSPEDLATRIGEIVGDSNLRDYLKSKGRNRSSLFTWGKCARQTLKVIEKTLNLGENEEIV